MPTHAATVRGARLHFEQTGSGVDLIWGHGLSQSREAEDSAPYVRWPHVPARLLRYDARGHGESQSTADLNGYSWAELAKDQLRLADHVGIDRYVVGGASMGCGTALHAAVLAPQRVMALVLVIPPTGWETRAAQVEQWETIGSMVEHEGVEAFINASAAMPVPDPLVDDPNVKERRAEVLRRSTPERLARVLRGAGRADLPPRETIATIAAPALILAWTGDPVHPTSTAEQLAELLPNATLNVASSRGHFEQWTASVNKFLSGGNW